MQSMYRSCMESNKFSNILVFLNKYLIKKPKQQKIITFPGLTMKKHSSIFNQCRIKSSFIHMCIKHRRKLFFS